MKDKKNNKKNKKLTIAIVGVLCFTFIIVIGISVLLTKRSLSSSPLGLTKTYFEKYQKLDKSVVNDIVYDFSDKLSSDQETLYKGTIKKQYQNLKYEVLEVFNDDYETTVTVMFTVIDLKSAYDRADTYVRTHDYEFLDDEGNYDVHKEVDYKLDILERANETIDYKIKLVFYQDELNRWVMVNPSPTDLQKISGTF